MREHSVWTHPALQPADMHNRKLTVFSLQQNNMIVVLPSEYHDEYLMQQQQYARARIHLDIMSKYQQHERGLCHRQ